MARVVWSVIEDKYEANLGVLEWFAKEDEDHLVESIDLINVNIKFFYKKDRFPDGLSYENLSDLKEYKMGSVRGSSTLPILEKAGIKADLVPQIEQNFKKLDIGRIDLTAAVDLTGWIIINDLFPNASNTFSMIDKPLLSLTAGIIFHKKHSDTIQTFKKGLNQILENGTYYEILTRYYGKDQDFEDILPKDILAGMKQKL